MTAFSSSVYWEVRTTGDDTNGGGFRGGSCLSTPSAPTVSTSSSGGSIAANTYYFVITFQDVYGETSASAQTSVTTTGSSSTITITAPTQPTGPFASKFSTWAVYESTTSGGPYALMTNGAPLPFGTNKTYTSITTSSWNAPGTDYAQQDSPQVTINNSTITCTTTTNGDVLTFTAGYTPTQADVGNVVHITAGTNTTTGWFEIISFSSTTWTLSTLLTNNGFHVNNGGGAGSAITGKMGGGFQNVGQAYLSRGNSVTSGQRIWIKSHATNVYSVTSTATNSAVGCLVDGYGNSTGSFGTVSAAWPAAYIGYQTTHGDYTGTRPIIQNNQATTNMIKLQGNGIIFDNITVDCNSKAIPGFVLAALGATCIRSVIKNIGTGGGQINVSSGQMINCEITAGGGGSSNDVMTLSGGQVISCTFHDFSVATGGTTTCVRIAGNACVLYDCILYNSTKQASGNMIGIGFSNSAQGSTVIGCTVTGFGGSGIQAILQDYWSVINCISYNNGNGTSTFDLDSIVSPTVNQAWLGNAYATVNPTLSIAVMMNNNVLLSANPFTSVSGNDLRLNSTAGGGTACKAAAWPLTYPFVTNGTNYADLGALQSQAAGGSLLTNPGMDGGMRG
jgi:hypothetical protein